MLQIETVFRPSNILPDCLQATGASTSAFPIASILKHLMIGLPEKPLSSQANQMNMAKTVQKRSSRISAALCVVP